MKQKTHPLFTSSALRRIPGTLCVIACLTLAAQGDTITRLNNAKFKAMVLPGDTVTLEVELKDQLSGAYFLDARVKNGDATAVTFDFACKLAQRPS